MHTYYAFMIYETSIYILSHLQFYAVGCKALKHSDSIIVCKTWE